MGAAAVIILAVITLVPVVKLAVLMVMYQGAAALLQPVCDKRIISCIQGMAAGHGLLLRITLYSLLVFVLVIAITCAGTNVSYQMCIRDRNGALAITLLQNNKKTRDEIS